MFWRSKKKDKKEDELLILFGTRSGNSKLVARQAEQYFKKNGMLVTCLNMSKYNPDNLPEVKRLLAVVSTQGEGEPPEQAKKFYLKMMGDSIENLPDLKYSVCALGDSAYEHYCKAGKDLEERLNQLGARSIFPRMDCDVEFSKDAARWIKECSRIFTSGNGHNAVAADTFTIQEELSDSGKFSSIITEKKKLNSELSNSSVYHVSLKVTTPGFSYSAGDSIEILPRNPEWLASKIAAQIQVPTSADYSSPDSDVKKFLVEKAEITRLNAGTVKRYQEIANDALLEQLINNKHAFTEYLNHANLLDLLLDFPCSLTPQQLFTLPPRLTSRAYSIASGPRQNPSTVDLAVKTIRYHFKNLPHEGSGSVFVTEDLQPGSSLEFTLVENPEFRLPADPGVPIIMIGVGTGIAPFRAFLQERSAISARNGTWLIWGTKNQDSDSLYKTELEAYKNDQILERLDTAFSRDDNPRKYVQDIISEHIDEVVEWLEKGAHIYVCGSIAMGKGVKSCLNQLLGNTAFLSVEHLQESSRYHEDVY